MIFWLRWLLLPLVIVAVFVWSYYSTEFLAKRGLPRRWIEPVAYFQTCFIGALAAGWCIPRWKTVTLLVLLIPLVPAGVQIAAWFDPITEQPTVLPFGSGLVGGALGIAIVASWEFRQRRKPSSDRVSPVDQGSGKAGR